MAEIILTPIAGLITQTLSSAAVEKIGALYSVRDELKDLEATLETIRAVLLDAESQQGHNNQVQLWLHRLADVVNDADDLVDGVAAEGMLRELTGGESGRSTVLKKVCIFFSSSNQLVFRRNLAGEITRVRKRLDKISADKRDFTLVVSREVVARPGRRSWRESYSLVAEETVVGRVDEKRKVLELLLEKKDIVEERVCVVSIFGMGGVGKTTLAQLVFNDETLQKRFDDKIWVCVSEDFEVKVILGSIVKSLPDTRMEDGDTMEKLQKVLREKLNGRRYLLVLDDVWNENRQMWQDLMGILSTCGDCGSRIIVTTRSERVAKLASSVQEVCRLGILSDDESWSLFKKMAFKQGREPMDSDGEEIGKEIVKKCAGIPLAIRMIASMLSDRDPKTEWHSFLKRELSSLPQQQNEILPTLKLSYDSLLPHLKYCFSYCGLFPKDYIINVQTLIKLWMAQGFISVSSDDDSQSVEDIGYDHFLELLERCFFHEAEIDEIMNKVVTCKMHDLVHDLAMQLAGKEHVLLLDPNRQKYINEKVRHFSTLQTVPNSLMQAGRLRSLLCLKDFSRPFLREMVTNLKFLRILKLKRSDIKTVPKSIGKLRHLRYLDLSGNIFTSLPKSITELVNLQTLRLYDCEHFNELPGGIMKLINLRHLEFSSWDSQSWRGHHVTIMARGVSQLKNLQTLSCFTLSRDPIVASQSSGLDELMGLNNLRGNLEIIMPGPGMETACANLKEKEHLGSVHLKWDYYQTDVTLDEQWYDALEGLKPHPNIRKFVVDRYYGARFSSWLTSLTNLVELRLERCLMLERLSSLEPLRSLTKMVLSRCFKLEYIITDVVGGGYFSVLPSLQQLELKSLCRFKGWQSPKSMENASQGFGTSYFPRLTNLRINGCSKLEALPLYPSVKKLELEDTNRESFHQTVLMSIAHPQISEEVTPITEASLSKSLSSAFYPLSEVKHLYLHCPNKTVINKTVVQSFPDWMQCLPSLEKLTVNGSSMKHGELDFSNGTMKWKLSGDDEHGMAVKRKQVTWEIFSGIRELWLIRVPAMKYLSGPIQCITSLEELHIRLCEELELATDENRSIKIEALTNLCTLAFEFLDDLVALPEWLQHITTLRNLKVIGCQNFMTIPDWICNFSALQKLEIRYCSNWESLPGSMSSLTCLHSLEINDCPFPCEGSTDPIKWGGLTSLRTLTLHELPKLVTLPEALQFTTTLQRLVIGDCQNLTALPDWIFGTSSSLRQLDIWSCHKIESLPGTISSYTSLQDLKIISCPLLAKRYGKETGKDWPMIKHIPHVDISS